MNDTAVTGKRFVSLGECMIELAPNPHDNTYRLGFAGDTFNTAWYLRKLLTSDWQISYHTLVGKDKSSDEFLEFARASGIDVHDIWRHKDKTIGLYRVHLTDGERSFSYWRNDSAARGLASDPEGLCDVMTRADAIYFSGISVAILPKANRENLFQALQDAKRANKLIVFDTNLRPKLWENMQAMTQCIARFATISDIILPSHDDERIHFGDTSPEDTLNRYVGYGAQSVVVKNGAQPVLATANGVGIEQFTPPKINQPVDTTAAGDSFNAGFLAGKLTGQPMQTSIRIGSGLASEVIRGLGALVDVGSLAKVT